VREKSVFSLIYFLGFDGILTDKFRIYFLNAMIFVTKSNIINTEYVKLIGGVGLNFWEKGHKAH